ILKIESNVSGGACDGPLDSRCDPVNAIADDPWNPGCVVAVIGLVHFLSHGRIVQVCDRTVKRLYFKEQEVDPRIGLGKNSKRGQDEPANTVAFFGIDRVGGSLWAVGTDALYRITQSGAGERVPLPKLQNADG